MFFNIQHSLHTLFAFKSILPFRKIFIHPRLCEGQDNSHGWRTIVKHLEDTYLFKRSKEPFKFRTYTTSATKEGQDKAIARILPQMEHPC